jgi:hypothetical protein
MSKPKVEVGRWDDEERKPSESPSSDSRPSPGSNIALNNLEALAWLMDSSIPVPGLGVRIGLDSLVGLIPVIGDALGALISSYILFTAAKMGVPRVTLLRMGFNITVDTVVGLVPFLGDLFDFAWKANLKNVALIRAHVEDPGGARRADWLFAALFMLLVAAILFGAGWAAVYMGRAVVGLFVG